ncbi:hypothetical protein P3S68_031875 [Capsicum galapagoense]
MANKWTKVKKLYMENESLRTTKLTRSEDTALHLAISSYHPDRYTSLHHPHLLCIKDMITRIPMENRECVLKQKNEKGNTPLHLAAEVGSVPIIECLVNSEEPELIKETNEKGETPLFITASRGKQDAFLYLHKCCQNENEEGPIELCRRKDGDNILHAAISGEYFELAFQIIHYYKPLINRYNTQGTSPLHILSRMPQVFRSGNRFRFIDSIIYYSITVKELEKETYKAERKIDLYQKIQRCGTKKFIDYIKEAYRGNKSKGGHELKPWKQPLAEMQGKAAQNRPLWSGHAHRGSFSAPGCPFFPKTDSLFYPDLTGVTNVNQATKPQDQGHQSDSQNDPENPPIQDATGVTNENQDKKYPAEGKGNGRLFTANYAIFIEFLKCLMKIVLLVSGIGLERIKKIKEKKSKRRAGVQIMKLMIEKEKRYQFYKNTGEKPANLYSRDRYKRIGAPPPAPPEIVDDTTEEDVSSNTAAIKQSQTSSTDEIKTDNSKSELPTTKETPLLVASKMGIVEMVRRILKKFPIAIQDTDSEEKNILLLAVEHRQTMVYNWLIEGKYPESVFSQEDKHGNNALHIAAKYQNLEVWCIPGKALQLQGEWKWYKYVKHTLPQLDVRYNKKGQTPRRVFEETHAKLLVESTEWISKTAASLAALIATVAFVTSTTIPGEADVKDKPHLENEPAFDVFSIASLVSLCFSVTALVFFLAILTSRCQHNDFEKDLPRKLLLD